MGETLNIKGICVSLAKRIIPTLLCRGRQLVKGIGFDSWRSVGLAAQAVRIHSMRGVDELILLDITATAEGRGPDLDLVRELSEVCFMPLSVGGGIRNVADVRALLRAGADKVVVNSAAWEVDGLLDAIANEFGRQALVVSIDADEEHQVHIRSGKQPVGLDAVRWASVVAEHAAGEIMLNSVSRDGTMGGYDLDLISAVSTAVEVPVIAAGGAGTYEHLYQAIRNGADAVAAGAMFCFTDHTPKGAAEYLQARGVEVRV